MRTTSKTRRTLRALGVRPTEVFFHTTRFDGHSLMTMALMRALWRPWNQWQRGLITKEECDRVCGILIPWADLAHAPQPPRDDTIEIRCY